MIQIQQNEADVSTILERQTIDKKSFENIKPKIDIKLKEKIQLTQSEFLKLYEDIPTLNESCKEYFYAGLPYLETSNFEHLTEISDIEEKVQKLNIQMTTQDYLNLLRSLLVRF
ncbi:MAG: hypothetical protein PHV68_08820 [Candidatus Gastranaerophilales bacterium]|nr:hypothetical protein [Candidatus Gastranaerophilales bacterium]